MGRGKSSARMLETGPTVLTRLAPSSSDLATSLMTLRLVQHAIERPAQCAKQPGTTEIVHPTRLYSKRSTSRENMAGGDATIAEAWLNLLMVVTTSGESSQCSKILQRLLLIVAGARAGMSFATHAVQNGRRASALTGTRNVFWLKMLPTRSKSLSRCRRLTSILAR